MPPHGNVSKQKKKPNGFIINHLAFKIVTPVGLEPTTH